MNTLKLAFDEFGESNNPALIILHGFFASSRNWRQMAKRFANDFHVYVLDIRNHGLSPHDSEMDYPVMAEDLKTFMNDYGLPTANLLGHSMGGKVVMWFALNHPERVDNLVVADISPISYQHNFDKTINALKQLPLEEISNRKQADDLLSVAISELSYRQFLLQNLQLKDGQYCWRINLDVFHQSADNIIGFPDFDSLPVYTKIALFIMGGVSVYTDKEAIYRCFPNADITTLNKANHWLHVDNPDGFYMHVNNFLQKE